MAVSGDVGGLQERAAEAAARLVVDDPRLIDVVAQPIVDLTGAGRPAGFELLARVPELGGAAGPALRRRPPARSVRAAAGRGQRAYALDLLARVPEGCGLHRQPRPRRPRRPRRGGPVPRPRRARALVVGVTERVWPEHSGPAEDALSALRARGALLAVDDVGAGFAGLTQISRLRPEMVKLDQALVADLGTDPAAELVVDALGRLCGQLDAWVVAEGIERPDQLSVLVRLGVPLGQGFLLGRGRAALARRPRRRRTCAPCRPRRDCDDDGLLVGSLVLDAGAAGWERDATGRLPAGPSATARTAR